VTNAAQFDEVESQTRNVVQGNQGCQEISLTSIYEVLEWSEKGVKIIALGASFMEAELGRLQVANALVTNEKHAEGRS
jgi:hypothetical protein